MASQINEGFSQKKFEMKIWTERGDSFNHITIRAPSIVAEAHVTKMQTKEEVLCFKFVVHWLKILPTFLTVFNKEQDIHCVEQNTV